MASDQQWDEELALSRVSHFVLETYYFIVSGLHRIPGSDILIRYIKNSHQNDPIRTIIEVLLVIFLVLFMTGKKYYPDSNAVSLTEREVDDLVSEWEPEELVKAPTELEQMDIDKIPTIVGAVGPKVILASTNGKSVTHLASYNFLDFLNNVDLKNTSIKTLRSYGVGACGPPGFYGTQDCHLKMETDIANFLGTDACIVYAQAFGTISSVIPAFAKRGDVLIVDQGVNFAIQRGLQLSRSTIKWFKHNDMDDLENVLQSVNKEQARRKSALTRRFIVTEGIFENHGDIVDLPKIIELKYKYKYRLILDESWSFATIGPSGRGITEYYDIKPQNVDMIIGNLTTSFCSGGGFCAASKEIVEHQRITGASYVFSAALPAMMAQQVSSSIELARKDPSVFSKLAENSVTFREAFCPEGRAWFLESEAWRQSPMQHYRFAPELDLSPDAQVVLLQEIVDDALTHGVLLTRAKQVKSDGVKGLGEVLPSLRITVTIGHSKKDLIDAAAVVRASVNRVMESHNITS